MFLRHNEGKFQESADLKMILWVGTRREAKGCGFPDKPRNTCKFTDGEKQR